MDEIQRINQLRKELHEHNYRYYVLSRPTIGDREFDLLKILMENRGIVLSRNTLIERVWGYDYIGETNVVDVYIRYLRGKIDDAFGLKLIQTVRGVGYVLRDDA